MQIHTNSVLILNCQLCLAEKLAILTGDPKILLNKWSELVSKCRHENKFKLKNLKFEN